MSSDLFAQLSQSLVDGDPEATVELTQEAIRSGIEPMALIQNGLMPGMQQVGEKFQCGEYFLPDLIIAADGMQKAMELLEPELVARQQTFESAGTVVLGPVKGDIHEIGKSLVSTMLSSSGFKVYDLGVDVPAERFIEKLQLTDANILGMSALLTTTMTVQRDVIEALDAAGLRGKVKVMVGGAPVTRSWAQEIGADGYAEDAMGAVQVARQLVEKKIDG
jgi:corrinoid protein of di/trimethylamine methyltransferase